jgi:hypothetical protein
VATLIIKNKFGETLEQHHVENDLLTWMQTHVPAYRDMCAPPYSATLNGKPWAYIAHGQPLSQTDHIDMTIEPRDPATALAILTVVLAGYSYYVASNLPQGYQDSTAAGTSIYSANAKANRVQKNGVIREVSGNAPVYPDLICPVRRVYQDHEEFLLLNLAIGAGQFDVTESNIYIAETPSINYFGDIDAQISAPGDDISNHPAHENWYQSREVSDLELVQKRKTPSGQWTVSTTSDTMTTKLDDVTTAFPFNVGEVFRIIPGLGNKNTSAANANYYRVQTISGANNETATVVIQSLAAGTVQDDPPTSLDIVTDQNVTWTVELGDENWEGPYVLVPEGETTNIIEYDVNFPNGLIQITNGEEFIRDVKIDVQWREVGTSTWNVLQEPNNISFFSDSTLSERGYTCRLPVFRGRPEIRFRRVTNDSKSTEIIDEVRIKRVRCLLNSPVSYPDLTTIQLKLRGTNALAQSAENRINIRGGQRKLPTLTNLRNHIEQDAPLEYTATSSIMRFVAWQMYQLDNTSKIDWPVFFELDSLLESRVDQLNADFADETTLWEALKIMLSPGYCEPTIKEGLLTPVRSAATNDYNFLYTPDLLLGNGIQRSDKHHNESESNGIIVEYIDSQSGETEIVNCFLAGDTASKAKRIQAIGITNRVKAWRYGMRERRRQAYKPATISFTTEMDALNSDYGNADGLVSPLNANQSFFVTNVLGSTITLDGDIDFGPNVLFAVFRKSTGEYSGMYQISQAGFPNQFTLAGPYELDFTPIFDGSMESTICAIGEMDQLVERIWIRSIDPSGTDTAKVTAEEYIPEIFADDNNIIESDGTIKIDPETLPNPPPEPESS